MNGKVCSKKGPPNRALVKSDCKDFNQGVEQTKSIKECLKLLEIGELTLVDLEGLREELLLKPHLADHIQYELHKYCQKGIDKTDADIVVKLAELCYSDISVSQFTNIDRFVGCVYYISSYLLKKEKYKPALNIINSLSLKKKEIIKQSENALDIRTFLCNLHSSFIASAIILAAKVESESDCGYHISHVLAMESLKFFELTDIEQPEVGKKVLKTSKLYIQTIKYYKEEDILKFYKSLCHVLKILLPNIGTFDFFLHYFHKMNQLSFESESSIYQSLKKTVHLLSLFLDCSLPVKCSLNKILDFFWNRSHLESWISNEELEILMEHSFNKLYFLLVSNVFSYGIQFLWTKYEKNWSENISAELVQKLSISVMTFHKALCRFPILYCSSTKGPLNTCFGNLLTGNLQKIQYTVRLCLKNKVFNALPLVAISQEAFKLAMECLEYMNVSGCCKEQRIYSWKLSVIHHRNTVEDICRYLPTEETWIYLKECSYAILKEIINSNFELPFDFKSINILFHRWHTASLKLKNYQDALYVSVVYYIFYPKEEKEIMSMWLQTKSETSNEIFQEITMSDIFKTYDKRLREFKAYDSSSFCLKLVLLMELKAYSTCPPDTFQNANTSYILAARIWRQLQKFDLDMWETSVALFSLLSANIAGDNEKLPDSFHEKYKNLIVELMNWKWKGKLQCRSFLHVANLTFSLFLYNVKMAEKSEGKMDATDLILEYLKKAEEQKVKFGEDVDLNLTCDVIPSSSHLTVELETNYLNELNKIVDLWSSALKNGFEESPTASEFDLWLRIVKHVAYLYELIGEYQRAFTTWLMLYKIGKLCDSSGAILLGLTHIIENLPDVDESVVKEEADFIFGKIGCEATEKHVLLEYSLVIASNYLKNKKPDKCLEYLNTAKKILESLRTTIKTYTLCAKFWCLVSKFLAVYKEYGAMFDCPAGMDLRVMAFKAFSYAVEGGRSDLIKSVTQTECTELVLTMLEVNLWAYYLYGVYRQTNFMRFFLDDLYQIVQKLFLPTRIAEILVLLAEVDVICEKLSDCQGKVTKLKSILMTVQSRFSEITKTEKSTSPYLSVPQKGDVEVALPRPTSPVRFLDKRSQANEMDASPVYYYLKDLKSSKASQHTKKCRCRLCQNLLIQTLAMKTIWLEAEIYNMENNSKHAAKCYNQANEILSKLELATAEQSKILRSKLVSALEEVPKELDFKLTLIQFHCAKFLIKYALFESFTMKSVTENVTKTILSISELINKFSCEKKLLQWDFMELKLYCFALSKGDAELPKKSTPVVYRTTNAYTPETSGGTTVVRKSYKKLEKSPHSCHANGKILFEDCQISPKDVLNTAYIKIDKVKTDKRIIQPRKLSFDTGGPETSNQMSAFESVTVKKIANKKVSRIQLGKLDFDLSGDLFEEKGSDEKGEETTGQKKTLRNTRKAALPPALPKKGIFKTVKIYTDAKDDLKAKKSLTRKCKVKAEKT